MKFRQYLADKWLPTGCVPLAEADLLGAPSSGASSTDSGGSSHGDLRQGSPPDSQAGAGPHPPENGGMPHGSGRPPDAMDGQLRKAETMASELLKLLTTMPRPWNRRFGVFNQALRRLLDKLSQIS